jgi:uncharacterized membrane-anchored protein YhcB (DUF1043 family)
MAQEHNISTQLSNHMGWIWSAIGVVGAGIVGVFRWLFNQNNRMKDLENEVKNLRDDYDTIKKVQEEHEAKHNEIIDKIEESSKYLAEEFRKSSEKMRTYFDGKYQKLEDRIYEQKK